MSGLEVAGVVLGAFPILISCIEHWRDVEKASGFFWQIRKEYKKCLRNIEFHEFRYKNNLKELLIPLIPDSDEVTKLLANPGSQRWNETALQEQLEIRLHGSYQLYQEIMSEMDEVADKLKSELWFDKVNLQDKLLRPGLQQKNTNQLPNPIPSKVSIAKGKLEYGLFRTKFSIGERVRVELIDQLGDCNDRLEKLLSSSDRVSALQNASPGHIKQASMLESAFKRVSSKSGVLFAALQNAWQCSCQQYHFANLRLEHRTPAEIFFEIIFMFIPPNEQSFTPWERKEIRCGHILECSSPQKISTPVASSLPPDRRPANRTKHTTFLLPSSSKSQPTISVDMPYNPSIELCQALGIGDHRECMGVISHNCEIFHLHSIIHHGQYIERTPIALDDILSPDFENRLSRRQRYSIALLVASSVGQLRSTPWLRSSLCKGDIMFFPSQDDDIVIPYSGPFIRQGFRHPTTPIPPADSPLIEHNFYALGILLLELCFGSCIEDHPLHKKYPPTADAAAKHAFDVISAMKWSRSVSEEAGDDYSVAVKWCFQGITDAEKTWRRDIIKNVVQPLERCMEYFSSTAAVSTRA